MYCVAIEITLSIVFNHHIQVLCKNTLKLVLKIWHSVAVQFLICDCQLFTGSVFVYAIIQLQCLSLCHVIVVFVKVQFPLHSRGLEGSKMIHLIVVLLAVLVPCIPVIAAFSTGGYSTAMYPQSVCFITDPDAAYYSFALMLAIFNGFNMPLLIISFMIVVKVHLSLACNVLLSHSSIFNL